MKYTLDDYMTAISNAQRAGDTAAVERLTNAAQADLTGEGTFTEGVGAGMQDVLERGKQWAGKLGFGDEIKAAQSRAEHERIAKMADPGGWARTTGQAVALAPTALVPGAATLGGAAALGGATGAFMEPENPLRGAAIGAVAGGGTQAAVGAAARRLPQAYNAMMDRVAESTPLLPGRKQAIAERAFTEIIPEAERAAVATETYASQPRLPGFQQTTAAESRNPSLLAAERQLAESGGPYSAPFKQRQVDQARAVGDLWDETLGRNASRAAEDARDVFTQQAKQEAQFIRPPGEPQDFARVPALINNELRTATGAHAEALKKVEGEFLEALTKASNTGSVEPLHYFRRTQLKEALTKLHREGAGDTAQYLRASLGKLKDVFDADMDALMRSPGAWSRYMRGYRDLSRDVGQARAGEALLENLRSRPLMGGTPDVHDPQALRRVLRDEFAGGANPPLDRFRSPIYEQSRVEPMLRQTMAELEQAGAPRAPGIAPANSATAANLQPMNRVLQGALNAQREAGRISGAEGLGAAIGVATGSPWVTATAIAKQFGLDQTRARAMTDIADRVVQLFLNPQEASAAIQRIGLAANEQAALRAIVQQRLGVALPPLATGAALEATNRM